jgi:hypothetical protein
MARPLQPKPNTEGTHAVQPATGIQFRKDP